MNSSNVLLLCIQMHVYIPFLISPLVLLFQIDLHVLDFVSIWYSLCFCFCFFRTRTVLHLLLCLLFYCCLPLHPLNLLIYLRYTRLSKFTCTLPLCFPLEKILLGVLYMLGPHFFFFFYYLLFTFQLRNVTSVSTTPWPSHYQVSLFLVLIFIAFSNSVDNFPPLPGTILS